MKSRFERNSDLYLNNEEFLGKLLELSKKPNLGYVDAVQLLDIIKRPTSASNISTSTIRLPVNNQTENLLKLMNGMYKCSERIKEYESKEISLNDLDSSISPYIIESKLKKRFLLICQKFWTIIRSNRQLLDQADEDIICTYKNLKKLKKDDYFLFDFEEINADDNELVKEYSKYTRQHREVPDYPDVLEFVEEFSSKKRPHSDEIERIHKARNIFEGVIKMCKKRRQENDYKVLLSRVDQDKELIDPAADDEILSETLKKSFEESQKQIDSILKEFNEKATTTQDEESEGEESEDEEENDTENDEIEEDLNNDITNEIEIISSDDDEPKRRKLA